MQDSQPSSVNQDKSYLVIVLKTGMEIVGERLFDVTNTTTINLKRPFQIKTYSQEDSIEPRIALFPYQLYSTLHDEINIKPTDIMFFGEAGKELVKYYTDLVSPIIKPAASKIILN